MYIFTLLIMLIKINIVVASRLTVLVGLYNMFQPIIIKIQIQVLSRM